MLEGATGLVKGAGRFLRLQLCILDPLGKVLIMFGSSMVILTVISGPKEPFAQKSIILLTGIACTCLGIASWLAGRKRSEEFKSRHASLMVIIIWFLLPLIGAVPLLPHTQGSLADAYFEAVSGLTASGATVLSGIDELPDSIKLWRGMMTWMGGMGLIVLAVAILPNIGIGGRQMMKSEITGPIKDNDLTPQINETAKGLWLVYFVLTLLCMACYFLAGMSFFDAVIHSFTTLGLGGFSNYDASFANFNSPAIEAVAVVFMVIAGLNFATHFGCLQALRSGHKHKMNLGGWQGGEDQGVWTKVTVTAKAALAPIRSDIEVLPYLGVLALAVAVVVGSLLAFTEADITVALRHGIFNTVSIATTTGYSNTDFYLQWPLALSFLILFLANFVSCSGSTGGGIKMIRSLIIVRHTKIEQVRMLRPYAFLRDKLGGRLVSERIVVSIFFFVLTYFFTILVFTMAMLALQPELDLITAFSAAMACVSNTGPGLGEVGPASNYAILNPSTTFVGALAMLLGRLEFLLFLLLFSRNLWR